MANEAVGHATIFARKRVTVGQAWGRGAPGVAGAGSQVEPHSESFQADSQLIENMGLNGSATQLPGVKGNELHDGSVSFPLYYRGLEGIIAQVFGSAATAGASGDLHKHEIILADTVDGIYDTFVACNSGPAIREWPFMKWTSLEFIFEDGKQSVLTVSGTPSHMNFNSGVAAGLVASVEPTNGALTVAVQPATPSPLSVLIVDANSSITEYVLTHVGTDRDDNVISEVYRKSIHGLTWTSEQYFKTVVSVTGSGLAGTTVGDTVVVGATNGYNNSTTVASITYPSTSERYPVIFGQLQLLINSQDQGVAPVPSTIVAGVVTDNDEIYIRRAMIKIERPMEGVVTTNLGNRRDEPRATSWVMVTFSFDLADWNTANHELVKTYLFGKLRKKATLTATGLIVTATTATSMKFWIQNMQFTKGSPNTSGPGRMPFQIEGKAHRALSTPTGFPGAKAIQLDITNGTGAVSALTL